MPAGIERGTDGAQEVELGPVELASHRAELLEPDPVLSAQRAAACEHELEDLVAGGEHALVRAGRVGVVQQPRVDVPVAQVRDRHHGDPMGVGDPRDVAQHLDDPVARHGEIVRVAAVVRAPGNAAGRPASVPDRGLLGGVERAARAPARVAYERLDRVERVIEALDERLDLDDEGSLDTGWQQTRRELDEEVEHRLVDVLERGRGQSGADDRLGGGTRALEPREPADDHARRLGHRQQRDQRGGDDRERPLAADHERAQIRRVETSSHAGVPSASTTSRPRT